MNQENITPRIQPPKGWRLATNAELSSLPHSCPLYLNLDLPGAHWREGPANIKGGGVASPGSCLYAVREAAEVESSATPTLATSPIPDSGSRTNFDTGAVRDAASGKGLYSRIPPIALRKLAKRFEDGAIKYPDGDKGPNWMQGIPLSRFYDAIQRHSTQAAEFDTSEDHLGAVLWNAAAWAWTEGEITAGRLPQSLNDLPFHAVNRHTGL